ncbi:hypothetical protein IW262DRAFT_133432 [Armillaria fumosa]|nr:hypothetical protein IW262DRAFT_133432 [Armillaria fumosa]
MSDPHDRLWDMDRLKLLIKNHQQHGRRRMVHRSVTCQDAGATKRITSMTENSIDTVYLNAKLDVGRLCYSGYTSLFCFGIFCVCPFVSLFHVLPSVGLIGALRLAVCCIVFFRHLCLLRQAYTRVVKGFLLEVKFIHRQYDGLR